MSNYKLFHLVEAAPPPPPAAPMGASPGGLSAPGALPGGGMGGMPPPIMGGGGMPPMGGPGLAPPMGAGPPGTTPGNLIKVKSPDIWSALEKVLGNVE